MPPPRPTATASIARYDWDFADGYEEIVFLSGRRPHLQEGRQVCRADPDRRGRRRLLDDLRRDGQIAYCNGSPGARLRREVVSPVPAILSLAVSKKRFATRSSGVRVNGAEERRNGKSEHPSATPYDRAATVTFAIQQRTSGRRVGGKCRRKTKANALSQAVRCAYRTRGKLRQRGKKGRNVKGFDGPLRKRALRPGRYRAVAVATRNKFKSPPRRVSFRVVR